MANEQDSTQTGPLKGLRVLDIGTWIAGPLGATMMAEFGAEVIKVEEPLEGDFLRRAGPKEKGLSFWWMTEGRNKKSVTLNLKHPEGRDILKALVRRSDVLFENFRPGVIEKWGLDQEALHAINPKLVMIRTSGFGQTGPYRTKAGYDRVATGYGGIMYVTGYPDSPPVRPGVVVVDYITGFLSMIGALLALYQRDAQGDGKGQWVDATLVESALRILEHTPAAYDRMGIVRERMGNRQPVDAPVDNFQAKDGGWIALAVVGDRQWPRFCEAIGRQDLADNPTYVKQQGRLDNEAELRSIAAAWVSEISRDEAVSRLQDCGLAAAPIYNIADVMQDPHIAAREDFIPVDVPEIGPVKMSNVTPRLSRTPGRISWGGPQLGQHNEEIYGGLLGLKPEDLARLRQDGTI